MSKICHIKKFGSENTYSFKILLVKKGEVQKICRPIFLFVLLLGLVLEGDGCFYVRFQLELKSPS